MLFNFTPHLRSQVGHILKGKSTSRLRDCDISLPSKYRDVFGILISSNTNRIINPINTNAFDSRYNQLMFFNMLFTNTYLTDCISQEPARKGTSCRSAPRIIQIDFLIFGFLWRRAAGSRSKKTLVISQTQSLWNCYDGRHDLISFASCFHTSSRVASALLHLHNSIYKSRIHIRL